MQFEEADFGFTREEQLWIYRLADRMWNLEPITVLILDNTGPVPVIGDTSKVSRLFAHRLQVLGLAKYEQSDGYDGTYHWSREGERLLLQPSLLPFARKIKTVYRAGPEVTAAAAASGGSLFPGDEIPDP